MSYYLKSKSKGQYSTFIKPIIVLVFGGLLVSLLVSSLNFNVGLSQDRSQVEFESSSKDIYSDLIDCIAANNTDSINKSVVRELEKQSRIKQPGCAKNYGLGYSVSVEQDNIEVLAPKEREVQNVEVAFVLDDTSSTQTYINAVKNNVKRFDEDIGNSKTAIVTFKDHKNLNTEVTLPNPNTGGTYSFPVSASTKDIKVDQDFTNDTSKIETTLGGISASGGELVQEAAYHGIKKALNELNWSSKGEKIIILTNTDGAHDGNKRPQKEEVKDAYESAWGTNIVDIKLPTYNRDCGDLEDIADESENQNISIYTLFKNNTPGQNKIDGCSSQITNYIPDRTGGESYNITESFNKILADIAGEVFKDEIHYEGGSTCDVPKVRSYSGSAELVVTADASEGYGGEWRTICQDINRTVEKLESRGLNTKVSYYAPSNPGSPTDGQGKPASITNSTGGSEKYDYTSNPVPSCLNYPKNNASTSSYGKGITEWNETELIDYNASKDSGIEAWGVSSRWILKNHDWNKTVDKRALFVVGNQLPFGGNSSVETYREGNDPSVIDGEEELVESITEIASNKNVEVNTIAGNFEYKGESKYGDSDENDASELMEKASSETGGSYLRYNGIGEIPRKISKQFSDISTGVIAGGTCENVGYEFGQTKGSQDDDLDESLTSTFPGSLIAEDGSVSGATVRITVRNGALERLAGAIDKATDTGKRFGEETTVPVSINNEKTINVREKGVERLKQTNYTLQQPDGNKTIHIRDDLVIGIDGKPVFSDLDDAGSTINFSKDKNQFNSYKGSSIQLIALTSSSRQKLPEIELTCADNSCNGNQTLNGDKLNASAGSTEFLRRGERGVYYTNYTNIKIGKTDVENSELACYEGTDSCIELEAADSENLTLKPGSHEVISTYNTSYGVKFE